MTEAGEFARPDATHEEQGEAFRQNGMHASKAAQVILEGVRKRRSRIFIGMDAKLTDLAQRLTPMHYDVAAIHLLALGVAAK